MLLSAWVRQTDWNQLVFKWGHLPFLWDTSLSFTVLFKQIFPQWHVYWMQGQIRPWSSGKKIPMNIYEVNGQTENKAKWTKDLWILHYGSNKALEHRNHGYAIPGSGSEQPGLPEGVPAHGRGTLTKWSLRSLSAQTILWFCDNKHARPGPPEPTMFCSFPSWGHFSTCWSLPWAWGSSHHTPEPSLTLCPCLPFSGLFIIFSLTPSLRVTIRLHIYFGKYTENTSSWPQCLLHECTLQPNSSPFYQKPYEHWESQLRESWWEKEYLKLIWSGTKKTKNRQKRKNNSPSLEFSQH